MGGEVWGVRVETRRGLGQRLMTHGRYLNNKTFINFCTSITKVYIPNILGGVVIALVNYSRDQAQ